MKGNIALLSLIALGAALPVDLAQKRSVAADGSGQTNSLAAYLNTAGANLNKGLNGAGDLSPEDAAKYLADALQGALSGSQVNPSGAQSGATKRENEDQVDILANHLSDILNSFSALDIHKRSTENTAITGGDGAKNTVAVANYGLNEVAKDANQAVDGAQTGDPATFAGGVAKGIDDTGRTIVESVAAAGDAIGDAGAAAIAGRDINEVGESLI